MKKVYFYATCLGNIGFSDTCINAIKLLQKEGVEVIYKRNQTCCGQPSYNSGYYDESRKIALYNIRQFNDKDAKIVVPSGSCAGMMRHDYAELFKNSAYEGEAYEFSQRVYELSQYLVSIGAKYEDKGAPIRITWHSNCHALRVQKSIEDNKKLLKQLANVELVELSREEECCGFGGTFSVKEPKISRAMVEAKVKDIVDTNIDALVSADAGCMLNISGFMAANNINIPVYHLYDFIANRIKG